MERGGWTLQQAKIELIGQVTHDLFLFYIDWIYEYVMFLSFYWSLVEHKINLFQLTGHENNIGRIEFGRADPQAMDLPIAVGDLSQLLLSTATEVATSIAPTRPKRTSLASY
jgi:hypothetical protein